ncbi:MAG TPA: oligosaccharide flippase family protein [Gemmatimonadales bacterium]|nr:oligosaccharide flippase family protein [Gemmatimonadales bacterium]
MPERLRERIRAALPAGALARNTAWMVAGNGSRLLLQAATFVAITRALGTAGYGAFAGVLAMVSLAVPFVGVGAGSIMIRNTARAEDAFARSYRTALLVTAVSGAVLFLAALALAPLILPTTIARGLIAAVAASDLLVAGFYDVSWKVYQAHRRMRRVAQLHFTLSALKLGAALALVWLVPSPTPLSWGVLYAAANLLGTTVAMLWSWREVCAAAREGPAPAFDPREGSYFSSSLAAQNIYNDLDKAMLARISTLDATGIYAAAYRLIEIAYVPVRSLFYAAYADFFQHGAGGARATLRFGRRLMPVGVGYAVAAGLLILLVAPILPMLSGAGYREAADAARWLALIPALRATHQFASDILTGANYQGRRTLTQIAVAAANIGFNLWLIPGYGWRGAAWASLLSDGLLALLMWCIVWGAVRGEDAREVTSAAVAGTAPAESAEPSMPAEAVA